MKKIITLMVVALMATTMHQAEAQKGTWYFGHGIHWVDYYGPMDGYSPFETTNWNGNIIPKAFSLGYAFADAFRAQASLSFTNIDKIDIHLINNQWLDCDLGIQYSLCNGYIIKKDFPIEPYLHAGIGLNTLDEVNKTMFDAGLGINLWTGEYFAFNWHSTYNIVPDLKDYIHHGLELKLRIASEDDSDGDGIVDSRDQCPQTPGLKEFDGCPDSDGDGIMDKLDRCPSVAGLASFDGCPDTDGDGIPDNVDKCPTIPGLKALDGCPDKDGDGIADKDDRCPDIAGLAAFQGCPDTDGDGLPDISDDCPTVAGPQNLKGCPDRDNDGIPDKDDDCPDVPGIKEKKGCPGFTEEKKKEVEEEIRFSAKNINFETGKDVIKKVSYKDLDNIVNIMNRFPTTRFSIDGHTDDVGNDASNLDLSERRAQAVKKYFIDKGIAAGRLDAKGFGETKPIADNGTPEGRAENRRVEIKIKD